MPRQEFPVGRIEAAIEAEMNLIREMPEEERPRERLWKAGARSLKTEELIAILLRTGMKGKSAVALALELLHEHGHSLNSLSKMDVAMLAKKKGVGRTKAIQLKAAFELARRVAGEEHHREAVDDPAKAAACVREEFRSEDREVFRVLLLDTKNRLIRISRVSVGTINASLVEPREVFKEAIAHSATAVILAHNHPSGDPTPSSEDIAITKRLVKAGELLNIAVHDHVIIGFGRERDYVSLKELGLM
jgi:DNA repair protein RadC